MRPLVMLLGPGQGGDAPMFEHLLAALHVPRTGRGRARTRRGAKGGRPVGYDTEAYKQRNVVERSFNVFKQWRGLATEYDKLALTYRGGVVLGAITIWLKALGDTP